MSTDDCVCEPHEKCLRYSRYACPACDALLPHEPCIAKVNSNKEQSP